MRTGVLTIAVVIVLALAVPTVAMTHGGKNNVDGKVTIAPATAIAASTRPLRTGNSRWTSTPEQWDDADRHTFRHDESEISPTKTKYIQLWLH